MITEEIRNKAQSWLLGNYDENTQKQIQKWYEDENYTELVDSFYQDLEFGTGGLRGIMGVGSNRINKYTIGAATQGLANYLKKSFPKQKIRVAIAHDSRNNSRSFAEITAQIFAKNDILVYLVPELRPTPFLSFAIRHLNCKSGVIITASHNPKEYNGYKAYWTDGSQLVAPHDKNVLEEIRKVKNDDIDFTPQPNHPNIFIIGQEVENAYYEALKSLSLSPEAIKKQENLKIVYTPIHGAGITMVPKALENIGFKNVNVVYLQSTPDGNFPTVVYPNPEEAEAMSMGLEDALKIDADLLLGTDPDADRVGIAVKNHHQKWQLLNGNQTASLLIYYLLKNWQKNGKLEGKEYIAKTIVTSYLLNEIANHYNVECFDTLTGFKYIAEYLRNLEGKKTYIGGGEESYGFLAGDFVRDKDAVSACALIAEMTAAAKNEGKTLFDELIEMYIKFGLYWEKLLSFTKKGKNGQEEIKNLMEKFRNTPPSTLGGEKVIKVKDYQLSIEKNLIDKTTSKLDFEKSNVLQFITESGSVISARPSGTEPKIKFYFSVKTHLPDKKSFDNKVTELESKIAAMSDDLGLG
ncbi:MAG: phospho-sugar mutase [Bacteroidetes bacterium]|nr:MAG: phospho-sugar mutase [Bacteroidota bacterium]